MTRLLRINIGKGQKREHESGKVGGTPKKVQAYHRLNIPLVILKRPVTDDQDSSGDIHEGLREIREQNPNVEIVFTQELGSDDGIANMAAPQIKEVTNA